MPSIGRENLETVMIDFFGALRGGDFDAAVCHGREEVLETFRMGLEQRREIDALEFTRGGEQVVLGARGPSDVEDLALERLASHLGHEFRRVPRSQ